jgi:hypothetical protein
MQIHLRYMRFLPRVQCTRVEFYQLHRNTCRYELVPIDPLIDRNEQFMAA